MGYSLQALRQAGLVTAVGYDAYMHRIVFPLEGNLYGRSISASAPPHRFLPGAKGGCRYQTFEALGVEYLGEVRQAGEFGEAIFGSCGRNGRRLPGVLLCIKVIAVGR